ncbi:MAG: YdeI/OmpD-associated family protein [Opitutales bacterium]|jgi:uncharacterized protein YdeI (YjbR/CyaY-like superfamily)
MKIAKDTEIPSALATALKTSATAQRAFERLSPSCRHEYIQWVAQAKKPEAQARRAENALQQIMDWGRRHPAKVR